MTHIEIRGARTHLEMTVTDALAFFGSVGGDDRRGQGTAIVRGLQLLSDVGVGTSAWTNRCPPCRAARRSA